jgi:transcription initiation factor TFIIB
MTSAAVRSATDLSPSIGAFEKRDAGVQLDQTGSFPGTHSGSSVAAEATPGQAPEPKTGDQPKIRHVGLATARLRIHGRWGASQFYLYPLGVRSSDVSEGRESAAGLPGAMPTCSLCGSRRRVRDPTSLEEHCLDCGLVFEGSQLVIPGPPVREEPGTQGSGRGIGPFTTPGSSRRDLGTVLRGTRDGQGRPLGWQRRYEFQHLRRVMQRQTVRALEDPLERSQARDAIAVAADRLALPPVIRSEAERFFRDATQRGLYRGRSQVAAVGASVYAACRRYSVPRTLGEVSKVLGARRSEVGRAFKVACRGMATVVPSVDPRVYLARYAQELALSPQIRSSVESMLKEAETSPEVSGLSAHGLVAALIYIAAERNGERRSRAQVARISAVTEVTLRSTSRLLERLLGPRPDAGAP